MAPDAENSPASVAKEPGCAAVAGTVAGDLDLPVLAVPLGHAAMQAAAVPETAVHEQDETSTAEGEVGATRERLVPPPAGEACSTKD